MPTVEQVVTASDTSVGSLGLSGLAVQAGDVLIVAVNLRHSTPYSVSVSGLGATWTEVVAQTSHGGFNHLSVWVGVGASGSGQVTATFNRTTNAAVATAVRLSGVDEEDPVGAVNVAIASGGQTSSPSVSLTPTAVGAAVLGVFSHMNRTFSVGSGWTAVDLNNVAGSGGTMASVSVQSTDIVVLDTVTVNGSLNANADWVASGIELKPAAAGYTLTPSIVGRGTVELDPPGGIYDEDTQVQVTAIPAFGWLFSGWSGDLSGDTNPETVTMDSDKTVVASFVKADPEPPDTIDGLVLRYDARALRDLADGDPVTEWEDLSPSGFDATGGASVAEYVADAGDGMAAVKFHGVSALEVVEQSDLLRDVPGGTIIALNTWRVAPTSANTVLHIANNVSTTDERLRHRASSSGWSFDADPLDTDPAVQVNGGPINDGEWTLYVGRANFGDPEMLLRRDGVEVARVVPQEWPGQNSADTPSLRVRLGGRNATSQQFDGMLRAILVYDRPLTDGEIATVEGWLAQVWGLPLPDPPTPQGRFEVAADDTVVVRGERRSSGGFAGHARDTASWDGARAATATFESAATDRASWDGVRASTATFATDTADAAVWQGYRRSAGAWQPDSIGHVSWEGVRASTGTFTVDVTDTGAWAGARGSAGTFTAVDVSTSAWAGHRHATGRFDAQARTAIEWAAVSSTPSGRFAIHDTTTTTIAGQRHSTGRFTPTATITGTWAGIRTSTGTLTDAHDTVTASWVGHSRREGAFAEAVVRDAVGWAGIAPRSGGQFAVTDRTTARTAGHRRSHGTLTVADVTASVWVGRRASTGAAQVLDRARVVWTTDTGDVTTPSARTYIVDPEPRVLPVAAEWRVRTVDPEMRRLEVSP